MQRTENEFDAERRILEASGTRDMASLVPRVLSNPPYGEIWIYFMISVKLRVLKAPYPLALSTELVSFHWVLWNWV